MRLLATAMLVTLYAAGTSMAAAADAILLNCTMRCEAGCTSSVVLPYTLRIDKPRQVVFDGNTSYSAEFSPTFIIWDERWKGRYSLNRSTLTLSEVDFNSPDGLDFNLEAPMHSGPCKKGVNQV